MLLPAAGAERKAAGEPLQISGGTLEIVRVKALSKAVFRAVHGSRFA